MNRLEMEGARPLPRKRAAVDVPRFRRDSISSRFDAQADWTPPDISRMIRQSDGALIDPENLGLACACALYNAGQPETLDRLYRSIPGMAELIGEKDQTEKLALVAMTTDEQYWEALDCDEPDSELPEWQRHVISYGAFSNKAIKRAARALGVSIDAYAAANREILEAGGRVFKGDGTLNPFVDRPHVKAKPPNNDNSIPQWQKDQERVDDWKREGRRREQARAQQESRKERAEEAQSEEEAYQIRGQSIVGYSRQSVDESQNLLGIRFLERKRGILLTGPSGIGKSTAIYQMTACWGCGQIAFAIRPAILPGLRVSVFQTEDSSNDLVEMSRCINRLAFSEAQLRLIERNTHIETINDAVGTGFIKKVNSFLEQKPSDLIILNPLSDFIPGELADEAEVKKFLRQQLNPLLEAHRCGVLCVQPTTKTNLQNTESYSWFDWQYWAAGSAEFARWARGAIVIVPTADLDIYRFIVAKRFGKIGWEQPENWFSHSVKDGVDLWIPANEAQIVSTKKKNAMNPEDLLTFIPLIDPISQESYFEECSRLKIGENRARRFINILTDQGKIEVVKIQRNGVKSAVGYRRTGEK